MSLMNHLVRRAGGRYSARIRVPVDLVDIVGRTELVKALGTSDPTLAKRLARPQVAVWHREFDELRARRVIEPSDIATAAWKHYQDVLERDEVARGQRPGEAEIEAERVALYDRVGQDDFPVDPLSLLDAQLDYRVAREGAKVEAFSREIQLAHLKKHLSENNTALIADEVDHYAQRNGLLVQRGDAAWISLARHLMRAQIEALRRTLERDDGDYSGAPLDPIVKPTVGSVTLRAAPGETIMNLFDTYREQNPRNIGSYTLNEARRDVEMFASTVRADTPVSSISKKSVRDWKALLLKYPVRAAKTNIFMGMTLEEIVEHNVKIGKPVLSSRTVNRHLSSLSAFCDWLVNEGRIDQNPVPGMLMAVENTETTIPFTVDEMNRLFTSPIFTGCQAEAPWSKMAKPGNILIRDYRYWVPLIQIFSGARPGEVAQLDLADLRQQDGVWIFHISSRTYLGQKSTTKRIKNKGSQRIVPVHSQLINLGILEHAKKMKLERESRLFPNAKRTDRGQMIGDYSREFGKYLTRIGLKCGKGLSLHSFRHCATDALRRAGYLDADFGYILGHGGSSTTGIYGIVPQGMLASRVTLIESIRYPDLTLDHLYI